MTLAERLTRAAIRGEIIPVKIREERKILYMNAAQRRRLYGSNYYELLKIKAT